MNNSKFKFLEFEPGQFPTNSEITALFNDEITGILIKSFLSEVEADRVIYGFDKVDYRKKVQINEGFISYPLTFAQFTQRKLANEITVEEYNKLTSELIKTTQEVFGVDFIQRLITFLEGYDKIGNVSSLYKNSSQYLVPYTFRDLFPGRGELIAHCENLFFKEFPDFFNLLQLVDIKDNKLSYFITLQAAEEGGELCCFDLNWRNVKERITTQYLSDEDGKQIDLENKSEVERFLIKPKKGDLLLFAGGNVWHRVEQVKGIKRRITVGGFIAERNEANNYYIWS